MCSIIMKQKLVRSNKEFVHYSVRQSMISARKSHFSKKSDGNDHSFHNHHNELNNDI